MRVFLQKIATPGIALADMAVQVRVAVSQLAATYKPRGLPHVQTVAYYDETTGGQIYLAPVQKVIAKEIAYKTLTNRDISGGDRRTLTQVDMSACVAACRSDAECRAFSYDKWNRYCFLKSSLSKLYLEPRSITGIRQDVPVPETENKPARIDHYANRIFLGDGYRSASASSYESCRSARAGDSSCVVTTFLKDENRCKFFNSTGEYFRNEKADSGVKTQAPR
jgi:PAN domain